MFGTGSVKPPNIQHNLALFFIFVLQIFVPEIMSSAATRLLQSILSLFFFFFCAHMYMRVILKIEKQSPFSLAFGKT
jgi:hypothetical protein